MNDGGRSVGKSLDGVSAVYSVSVTAGDFEGDRKDEFAVVFRDNKPDFDVYKHMLRASDFMDVWGKRVMTFEGLTGRIHVVPTNGTEELSGRMNRSRVMFPVSRQV